MDDGDDDGGGGGGGGSGGGESCFYIYQHYQCDIIVTRSDKK